MKKVKINGKWVEVKDADVLEEGAPTPSPSPAPVVTPTDGGDADISEDAKLAGEELAKGFMAMFSKGTKSADVAAEVQKALAGLVPQDAKLNKILGGKDLVKDASSLTKEEKIVGFFHAAATRNEYALKALSEGTDADGGYLFPNEFLTELVRALAEFNVMRKYVRIIPMKRDKMDIATLVSGPKVSWTAENAAKSTTSAHFGTDQLVAKKLAAILYASDELIEDSDIFDVVSLIIQLFAEEIGSEEEKVIWTGNGTTQPEGIDAAGTVPSAGAAGGLGNFDHLINLFYSLPSQYRANAAFFMNDNTAKLVSKLKDTAGQYLWQPSVREGEADTIKGKPVVISNWVPNGKIYFGDMKRTYFLGDRKRMTIKVSQETETAFTHDQTAIRVVARIAGAVVQPSASRVITGF